jgi:hypothetical protein
VGGKVPTDLPQPSIWKLQQESNEEPDEIGRIHYRVATKDSVRKVEPLSRSCLTSRDEDANRESEFEMNHAHTGSANQSIPFPICGTRTLSEKYGKRKLVHSIQFMAKSSGAFISDRIHPSAQQYHREIKCNGFYSPFLLGSVVPFSTIFVLALFHFFAVLVINGVVARGSVSTAC